MFSRWLVTIIAGFAAALVEHVALGVTFVALILMQPIDMPSDYVFTPFEQAVRTATLPLLAILAGVYAYLILEITLRNLRRANTTTTVLLFIASCLLLPLTLGLFGLSGDENQFFLAYAVLLAIGALAAKFRVDRTRKRALSERLGEIFE